MPTAIVVEDEAVIALDLACELEGMGFKVIGLAKSPESASKLARRRRPDIALVDLMLGGAAEGERLAAELRAQGVKVRVISGDSTSLGKDGWTTFLAKPWSRADLVNAINALAAGGAARTMQPALGGRDG